MDELLRALQEAECPPTTVMEVCGTHTHAVARSGLRAFLPKGMRLISGPGCPVCVTDDSDLLAALHLARRGGVIVFSFGDMLRVPAGQDSLWHAREMGADVRIAVSPMDALECALREPGREVVWLGVGFETTAPLTAAMLMRARTLNVKNLSVLSAHKTMPAALRALLRAGGRVQALLCPGHVASVVGAEAFRFLPEEMGLPAVVSGFEPQEIGFALLEIARMRRRGEAGLKNCYPSVVSAQGNQTAKDLLDRVFSPCDARWRGLGEIAGSGLALREEFADYDARARFHLPSFAPAHEKSGCLCADILRGEAEPADCPLFSRGCTPQRPCGPCMVSSEGACAAAHRYGGF